MRSIKTIILSLIITVFISFQLFGDTKIVKGKIVYTFEVYSSDKKILDNFREYKNESNEQKVIKRESGKITVRNTANLSLFDSNMRFPIKNFYSSQDKYKDELDLAIRQKMLKYWYEGGVRKEQVFFKRYPLSQTKINYLKRVAKQVTSKCTTQAEAVEAIMTYIRTNVSYQLGVSVDPVDVLRSGKAFCEGYANVGILLLRVLGIPARKIECYIPPGHFWGFGGRGGGGFHAYLEAYYNDKGWVSYDPQASIHFSDPFHIIDYPRKGVSMKEIKTVDEQEICDIKNKPSNWDNYYQRQSSKKQNNALIVGKIYDIKGELVSNSFVTKKWVTYRTGTGTDPGIRILESGWFAIPAYDLNKPITFYYYDRNGGYLEKTIKFTKKEKKLYIFRLKDESKILKVKLPNGYKNLVYWIKNNNGKYGVRYFRTAGDNTLSMYLGKGKYIVSLSNNLGRPRYVIDVQEDGRSGYVKLQDLPSFMDPASNYVHGRALDENGKPLACYIQISSKSGSYYPPFKTSGAGYYNFIIRRTSFNQVRAFGKGFLFMKVADFNQAKHFKINFDLKNDIYTTLLTKSKNAKIYINYKKGNLIYQFANANTDDEGKLRLILPDGKYFISIGTAFSSDMKEITIKKGSNKEINLKN